MSDSLTLLDSYIPESLFDDVLIGNVPKAHWLPFLNKLSTLSSETLEQLQSEIRRQLKENGVIYNLNQQSHEQARAWQLDIIPNILAEDDWQQIEKGIKQRAKLFQLILQDCYREQKLLRNGLIPPEIIFAHRGFLLPAYGTEQPLTLYACDLARGINGYMWIVSDRTQVPSGMGFALENRMVMSHVLAPFFQGEPVKRLAHFFNDFQQSIARLSPRQGTEPNIVLLSPGIGSETYFEHAYLASYLGYTLVQGDDLTVREGEVFLKTIEGLEPVDVILRRVDDDACDPLELRPDSRLGSPGLMEAVRRGKVGMANSLGSSLLENPGLVPFLPKLCQQLLGEELQLPSVATWWCGQEKEKQHVLTNLPKLMVKRIDRKDNHQTFYGAKLSQEELAKLKRQVEAEAHLFVGQDVLEHATTPVLMGGRLEPRHALLRSFAVADGDDYSVMPGGLSRSSVAKGNVVINNRMGGMSKDTWVSQNQAQRQQSFWQASKPSHQLPPSTVSSRSADNLFWVGCYAEKAEYVARLLRLIINLYTDSDTGEIDDKVLAKLINTLYDISQAIPPKAREDQGIEPKLNPNIDAELLSLIFHKERSGSLHQLLSHMLGAAYAVKGIWSNDSWRVLVSMEEWSEKWAQTNNLQNDLKRLENPLNLLISSLMAFAGLNAENMNQGTTWRFLDMGRRSARAILISQLIQKSLSQINDVEAIPLMIEKLLTVSENIITYRRLYRRHLDAGFALKLLMFDEHNPRALAFQLKRLEAHLAYLPQHSPDNLNAFEKNLLEARSSLRLSDGQSLASFDEAGNFERLDSLLKHIIQLLEQFSNNLSLRYFSHTQVAQQLADNNAAQTITRQ
ncbi:MAG: circularly permuted type 2 ATP-grasp protein [Deinococcales bacterium]